ncbi:hypothetical protein EV360DRAFT_76216 [Lentinula raphanica]|nr:hypothetical protein EV360DRAFT_76216 [Lentinula raphanica]
MQLCSSLPNELLHSIIEYIAYTYTPELPKSCLNSLFKRISPDLLVLSVADWRLCQLCLPFLFEYIEIKHIEDAERLEKDVALLSRFTRGLGINIFSQTGDQIIIRVFPLLEQLCYVRLRDCQNRTDMLRSLLKHPTVTSILVHELPRESMCKHDLMKLIYGCKGLDWIFPPIIGKFLNQGMRALCLELHEFNTLERQIGSNIFPGLKEIQMRLGNDRVSFSFLSTLPSTHPTLELLWLYDIRQSHLARHKPSFMLSFIENSHQQNIERFFSIEYVGLGRALGQPSNEWHVMGLTLHTTVNSTSLIEILTLVATSFLRLRVLTLNLTHHQATYHIRDLATAFGQFSSLRTLSVSGVYQLFEFGNIKLLPTAHQVESTSMLSINFARAETGLLWFTSCVAKEVRTLDAIYVSDVGVTNENEDSGSIEWRLEGWFYVLNGNRDIGGTLQRGTRNRSGKQSVAVSLETRMLHPDLLAMGSPISVAKPLTAS